MMDVTVVGLRGAAVTIPFTSQENYALAQAAATNGVTSLSDSNKFEATGGSSTITSALGIISNVNNTTITGTGSGATVLAGGSNVTYYAANGSQFVYFSADGNPTNVSTGGGAGSGNFLANNSSLASTQYFIDGGGTSSAPGTTVNAALGTATVNTFSGYVEVLGGSGTVQINNGGASDTLVGNMFSVDVTQGANTINASGAIAAVVTVASGATADLAGGYYLVENVGTNAVLSLGANDTVLFAPGVNVAAALGAKAVSVSGGSQALPGDGTYLITGTQPAANDTLSGSSEVFFGNPYAVDAFGYVTQTSGPEPTGNDISIHGGAGSSQTLFGAGNAYGYGIGSQFFGGSNGNNLLVGAFTIVGGGTNDTLVGGAFTQSIKASAGNSTLIGGVANTLGYVSDETLVGAGSDTFIFGTGNETITGNGGTNTYIDLNQTAKNTTVTITDFNTSTDKLELSAFGTGAAASAGPLTASGSDTLLSLSDGVTIRFVGLAPGAFTSTDIQTVPGAVK